MNRIMVMEDDQTIYQELCTLLQTNGYQPVDQMPCELALLDINLPGESGYEICRKIRETSGIPIIFLTARERPEDELLGFAVGADDFIRKPYHSAVLLARIAKHLRPSQNAVLQSHGLSLDLTSLKVRNINIHDKNDMDEVELTKNEAHILSCLIKKEMCTREELIEDLWSNSLYIDENTLYVNINRLREKLKSIQIDDFIKTVRGVGYRL